MRGWDDPALSTGYEHAPNEQGQSGRVPPLNGGPHRSRRSHSTCVNQTAARIALPTFDGEQLTELIKKLVLLDSRWIPGEPGYSLYIRESSRAGRFFLAVHRRSRQGVDSSTIRRTDLDRYAERFGRPS